MPTVLGPAWKKTIGRTPPHMSVEDEIMWDKWKDSYLKETDLLYFDVGLGDGAEVTIDVTPEVAAGWIRDTQKRADLIVDRGKEWWIVEFRYFATANAVGRLLMYKKLFEQDLPRAQPIKLLLVTNRYDRELEELSTGYNIDYQVI